MKPNHPAHPACKESRWQSDERSFLSYFLGKECEKFHLRRPPRVKFPPVVLSNHALRVMPIWPFSDSEKLQPPAIDGAETNQLKKAADCQNKMQAWPRLDRAGYQKIKLALAEIREKSTPIQCALFWFPVHPK
jgi:hypothetical protein